MLRLLVDEHFPRAVIRGLVARVPGLDLVRVVDIGLKSVVDPSVLAWAEGVGRVIVSADRQTMIGYAYDRLAAGDSFAGVVIYQQRMSVGQLIDDLLVVLGVYEPDDIVDQVLYLPL